MTVNSLRGVRTVAPALLRSHSAPEGAPASAKKPTILRPLAEEADEDENVSGFVTPKAAPPTPVRPKTPAGSKKAVKLNRKIGGGSESSSDNE